MAANIIGEIARMQEREGWGSDHPVIRAFRALALDTNAGTPGPPGPTQFVTADVPFAFNDGSPLVVVAVPAGSRLIQASVVVEVAFDDPAAMLELGVTLDLSRILAASDIVPSVVAQYLTNAAVPLGLDVVVLSISPGASTMGSGRVVLVALRGP